MRELSIPFEVHHQPMIVGEKHDSGVMGLLGDAHLLSKSTSRVCSSKTTFSSTEPKRMAL